MPVRGHVLALVLWLVLFQECRGEIGNQLNDLLGLPLVFALVVIDAVLGIAQQLAHAARLGLNFLHCLAPDTKLTSCFRRPSVSASNARISAVTSSRLRSGLC